MNLVFDAPNPAEEGEFRAALLSLERLGMVRTWQQVADGSFLIEVDGEFVGELSRLDEISSLGGLNRRALQ
ncbi:MAG: hypothetical protein CL858_13550 [Cupriavidus sp.]|nr:hypothetical protein [Cupriavidus sp.]